MGHRWVDAQARHNLYWRGLSYLVLTQLALLSTHRSSAVADLCSSHPGRHSSVIQYFARVRDPIYKWISERGGQCVSEVFDSYDTNAQTCGLEDYQKVLEGYWFRVISD